MLWFPLIFITLTANEAPPPRSLRVQSSPTMLLPASTGVLQLPSFRGTGAEEGRAGSTRMRGFMGIGFKCLLLHRVYSFYSICLSVSSACPSLSPLFLQSLFSRFTKENSKSHPPRSHNQTLAHRESLKKPDRGTIL